MWRPCGDLIFFCLSRPYIADHRMSTENELRLATIYFFRRSLTDIRKCIMKDDLVAIYTLLKKAVQLQFADRNYTKYYAFEGRPSGD